MIELGSLGSLGSVGLGVVWGASAGRVRVATPLAIAALVGGGAAVGATAMAVAGREVLAPFAIAAAVAFTIRETITWMTR